MADQTQTELLMQAILYLLNNTVNLTPPSGFKNQVIACKNIVKGDITGLISTVLDFVVDAVSEVKFKIVTENKTVNKDLNNWLSLINRDKTKFINAGFTAVVKQYVREWFTSGLCLVRYNIGRIRKNKLPVNIWIANSEDIESKGDNDKLDFKYQINNKPISKNFFLRKDGMWYDGLPTPFIIRRGIWHQYQLKARLKNKSAEVMKELLWYLFMLKKKNASGKPIDAQTIASNLKTVLQNAKDSTADDKSIPAYITDSDTEVEHVLPDLAKILTTAIYEQIDKDILAGLGLIDIVQSIGSTRREAVLNPKPLVQMVIGILIDIESLLLDLLKEIIVSNSKIHKKLYAPDSLGTIRIIRTPLKAFWTDAFKEMIRSFYDRGLLSYETTLDSIGFDVETEVSRREQEMIKGLGLTLYPRIIINREDFGIDIPSKDDEDTTEDKKGVEKLNYTLAGLELAPFKTIEEVKRKIAKNFSDTVAKKFMKIFNAEYDTYIKKYDKTIAERLAIKIAWNTVKKLARKNSKGVWVLKRSSLDNQIIIINELNQVEE